MIYKKIILLITLLVPMLSFGNLGTEEINFLSPSSDRELTAEIYYPTTIKTETKKIQHGIWLRDAYEPNSEIISKHKRYPLVIFSHGFQGDRFGNSWLAERLTKSGYIVAMLEHKYNTSFEHNDLFVYTSMWQRPIDLSEFLTHLLNHHHWGHLIDSEQIVASGFSLGGLSALWLSGIEADEDAFKAEMNMRYARWADWPKKEKLNAESVKWEKATRSYQDDRIKAIIAISPDLGQAFTANGLQKSKTPTLILVGDKDSITPLKSNAQHYANGIKTSELTILKNTEHFSFLNECSPLGEKIVPYLCHDSFERKRIQDETMLSINRFLSIHLQKKN